MFGANQLVAEEEFVFEKLKMFHVCASQKRFGAP